MRTQVVKSSAFERVKEKFSVIAEEDIEKFISELRDLLKKEFQKKRKKDKKILLTFK